MSEGTSDIYSCGHPKQPIQGHCQESESESESGRETGFEWLARAWLERAKFKLRRARADYADNDSPRNLTELHAATDHWHKLCDDLLQRREEMMRRLGISEP
ncbi:MAG: hypothetical protein M1826_000895 [Phylliscum demangeonii]|nr:MAG: hypothetical protein M1826_000895 [Phylliscum demangeonii]